MRALLSRILAWVEGAARAFVSARTASAAVEFAVVLPVALGLYMGAAEVTQGIMTSRKVNLLTRTVTDLLSQQSTSQQTTSTPTPANALTAAQLSTIMNASQILLAPQPTTTLSMTLTAVDVTANSSGVCCVAKVRWSYTQGGTLRPCNVTLTAGADGTTKSPTTISTSLLIVAEATRQVPRSLKETRPDLPWARLDGLDDLLGHELARDDGIEEGGEPWPLISDHLEDLDAAAESWLAEPA